MAEQKAVNHKTQNRERSSWLIRLGWLIVIWSMSVLTLGVIAFAIRKFMVAAGMST